MVADAVPLSHQPHHLPLLPTLELALTLVEDHFAERGLAVVGYYHANTRRDDADLPTVAKHIRDHIFRYFPRAAVLLVGGVLSPLFSLSAQLISLIWMLITILFCACVPARGSSAGSGHQGITLRGLPDPWHHGRWRMGTP
jgi:hypothetical protein